MLKIQFIEERTNKVFIEKSFATGREMHRFLRKFDLKEGDEFTFIDGPLKIMAGVFNYIGSFIEDEDKGFRIHFTNGI